MILIDKSIIRFSNKLRLATKIRYHSSTHSFHQGMPSASRLVARRCTCQWRRRDSPPAGGVTLASGRPGGAAWICQAC